MPVYACSGYVAASTELEVLMYTMGIQLPDSQKRAEQTRAGLRRILFFAAREGAVFTAG